MKLSAVVLIGVNLAAGLQTAALAADTEVGESAAFLQESLVSIPKAKTQAKKPLARKMAMSTDISLQHRSSVKHAKTFTSLDPFYDKSAGVRPFVPGRYLPSEAELLAQKEAATARKERAYQTMAARADLSNSLSGRVSDFAMSAPIANATKHGQDEYMRKIAHIAVAKAKNIVANNFAKLAPRSVPGVAPVMPGQIAEFSGNPGFMPSLPEPGTQAAQPMPMARSITPVMPPVPMLTAYEQRQLSRQVEANMPEVCYSQGSNGEMRALGQGNPGLAGAGPPPFPLSMVGGGQLQQSMRAGSPRLPATAQARFGSWHGGSENLQNASFHTYLSAPMNGPLSVSRVPRGITSSRTSRQTQAHPHLYRHMNKPSAQIASKHSSQSKAQPYVATYSAYRRYSG